MKIEKLDKAEYERLVADTLGKKVRIVFVEGEPTATGMTGTVERISETGKLRGTWGNFTLDCILDKWEVID